ncbi:MAG: O-antigen ligase family protein [Bryobacteraceae bacterium]
MKKESIALILACAAAAATVVSIAAFEILLGAALIAVIATGQWRWPPITLPLCLWFALTIASAAASGHFDTALPQLKKFYVYLMLFVVYSAVRSVAAVRATAAAWAAGGALSAFWSFEQLARKYHIALDKHQDFYTYYVANRITGFMGHWMTFSGEMMVVLLLILALLFFSSDRGWKMWLGAAIVPIGGGLLAAYTRSMWLGAVVGGGYLIWMWRRWMILAIPVLIGLALLANPFAIRERVVSITRPRAELDSNEHRVVTRRIGVEIIKAHPLFGIGPEQIGKQYEAYVPADIHRPLPDGFYGHLHNIYIHYAAERGVPAVLALLWAVGQALFDLLRARRRLPRHAEQRWVLNGAIAVVIAVMLSGWYELNLGDSEVLGMFLAVIACGYAVIGPTEEDRASTLIS